MKRVAAALTVPIAFAVIGLATTSSLASKPAPSLIIEETVAEVLAVLDNEDLTKESRRQRIQQIAYTRFDMKTMSRLVLARNWKRFSPEQQDEYIREFKRYLANNYGERLDRYDQEKVEIVGERVEPRGDVTVKTKIVGGQYEDATVDYRMRQKADTWYIIDVIVEGISLVANYRDQFKEVLSRGGPENLLEQLRKKNAAGSVDEKT